MSRKEFVSVNAEAVDECELGESCVQDSQPASMAIRTGVRVAAGVALVGAVATCVVLTRPAQPQTQKSSFAQHAEGVQLSAAFPTESPLAPQEKMHDGNVCADSEELFMGLCYKRCSLLTSGVAPIRTSSWTCCEGHPCGFSNQHGDMGSSLMCGGYDVNADGGCPHAPGACLVDEEMSVGICYKKCSILTQGEYPFRTAASTCCKMDSKLQCMNPMNAKTSPLFDIGGGSGDHDPSTPWEAHPPETALTEAAGSQVQSRQQAAAPQAAAASTPAHSESQAAQTQGTQLSSIADVMPTEHMHDGNVCDDSEEMYGGLCYKRCSLLTEGKAPIRTSSWTCCEAHPCGIWNQMGSVGATLACDGYDVNGNGGCPHSAGACLADEETFLNVCYKKCSILTEGQFPNRVSPATCCKTHGMGCLNPWNDKTSSAFDLGGGVGGHDTSAHMPEESLTEDVGGAPSSQMEDLQAEAQQRAAIISAMK